MLNKLTIFLLLSFFAVTAEGALLVISEVKSGKSVIASGWSGYYGGVIFPRVPPKKESKWWSDLKDMMYQEIDKEILKSVGKEQKQFTIEGNFVVSLSIDNGRTKRQHKVKKITFHRKKSRYGDYWGIDRKNLKKWAEEVELAKQKKGGRVAF